jgi:hypothetical protein
MTNQITFGSDPEFFLWDEGKRRPVVAVGLVGGTKDKPRMVEGYGLQEDNVMAEITTPPAETCSTNLSVAVAGVGVVLRNLLTPGRYRLHRSNEHEFTLAELREAGPQAMQFGCSPDFDGYATGARHPRVSPDALLTDAGAMRFAGGHIHVGYKAKADMPEYVAALLCDLTIGLFLTMGAEKQGKRRQLYGMAGRFRPTKYGVEYRTPSNQWLYDERLRNYLNTGANMLVRVLSSPMDVQVRLYNEVPWNDVREAINTENTIEAQNIYAWVADAYSSIGLMRL